MEKRAFCISMYGILSGIVLMLGTACLTSCVKKPDPSVAIPQPPISHYTIVFGINNYSNMKCGTNEYAQDGEFISFTCETNGYGNSDLVGKKIKVPLKSVSYVQDNQS
jgi:hypothetical protein